MSDESPGVDAIFTAALAIESPSQRAAYLNQACGEDRQRLGLLHKLLDAHEQAGSFLRGPAPELQATVARSLEASAGQMIGPYKLRELLGEGGMGSVWAAEQKEPLQRKVALKLIKPGMDSQAVLARFEVERQALAMMDHPNIARVYDAGVTELGRPYFAMELIRGVAITTYCDEHKLTVRQRLDLFVEVCRAIQHAHQKGDYPSRH